MSEAFFDPSAAAAVRGPSAGALLKQAREAAGLHVAALAVSMKVPVRRLEALEADRWDELPDAVFIRALAASVCRTLKIDPAPVLERLPQVSQRVVEDRPGINQPFHDPRSGGSGGLFTEMSRPLLGAIVALVVAAALIAAQPIWGPWMAERGRAAGAGNGNGSSEAPVATLPAAVAVPATVSSLPRTGPLPAVAPEASSSAATAAAAPLPAAASAPVVVASSPKPAALPAVPAPVASAAPPALAQAPSAAASRGAAPAASLPAAAPAAIPPPSAPGVYVRAASAPVGSTPPELISVRVSAEVWVSITDGKGQSLIRRTVQPGEALAASGALPLFVVVGRVQSAQVQVRGKAFDVVGISKDNVARFEVR